MATLPVYIRFKRENTTAFLSCEAGDTMLLIKSKLQEVANAPADQIRILGKDRETIFEDESTVADHQLKDNDILFFVLKTSGDNYEDIKIHKYADSDVPEPKKEGEEAGADESKK